MVLPATAHVLAAAASGAAPNRLCTVLLALTGPVVFFPHMGAAMWRKPAVLRNVAQIRADGNTVVEPVWHDSFDVVSQAMVHHPSIPAPADVVKAVVDLLR